MESGVAQAGLVVSAAVYLAGLVAAALVFNLAIVLLLAIGSAGFAFLSYHAWLWNMHGFAGGLSVVANVSAICAGVMLVVGIV